MLLHLNTEWKPHASGLTVNENIRELLELAEMEHTLCFLKCQLMAFGITTDLCRRIPMEPRKRNIRTRRRCFFDFADGKIVAVLTEALGKCQQCSCALYLA